MTDHLTPRELLAAGDGALGTARLHHVESCEACRAALESLGAELAELRTAGAVPEPSPLFWDHFSARVREAVESDQRSAGERWWRRWPSVALAGALVLLVVMVQPAWESRPSSLPAVAGPVVPADLGPDLSLDRAAALAGETWDDVTRLATAMDETDLLVVGAVGPTRAILIEELTPRELEAFARLIRAEMGGVQ